MKATLLQRHGATLLNLAARSIEHGLQHGAPLDPDGEYPSELEADGASFVTLHAHDTLHSHDTLRGCIGSPEAYRPLIDDVARNAFAAAFEDPRFPPLRRAETPDIELAVSVLSAPTPMHVADEPDLLQQLRPGRDGLILQEGSRRALFLPAVWQGLPDPREFVEHLKVKAGLRTNYWSGSMQAWRFSADEVAAGYADSLAR
jgi:AmmeMemoRadiSam system protein A